MRFRVRSGVLIPVLLLAPNILFLLLPPLAPAAGAPVPVLLTVAENIGRAAVLIIPVFYAISLKPRFARAALAVMVLALLLYYGAWIRYFTGGRSPELLSAPLLGIPLPLAVAPAAFLLAAARVLSSWPLAAAAVWFGVFHIWVTALAGQG